MTRENLQHMITNELASFLIDRRSRRLSHWTITYYENELGLIVKWLDEQGIKYFEEITPTLIRLYLLYLGERRNPGGVRAGYVSLRAWLNWFESEYDLSGWHNPIHKVRLPKQRKDPIQGITLVEVQKLLDTCDVKTEMGRRDETIFLFLLDSGLRMAELLALNVGDVSLQDGRVYVKNGKGDKPRQTFIGPRTRRELQRYLRYRKGELPDDAPLFVTTKGNRDRLSRGGLRQMMDRRAALAGITASGLHSFRRAFTIEMLRSGADMLTISRLLGHSSINLVQRYAKQTADDLRVVHERTSPVDKL